jgi:hypothetical protein
VQGADPAFARAWDKLNSIETGRAKPGSTIVFSPIEIDAWLRTRVPQMFDGVRNPRLVLGMNSATGSALVDFVKFRQSEGDSTNPLIAKLIEGERPVKVAVRLESAGGTATVHLTSLEISGVAITGSVLDLMLKVFFLPFFPNAHINEPFELNDNIERIDVRPTGIRMLIKR